MFVYLPYSLGKPSIFPHVVQVFLLPLLLLLLFLLPVLIQLINTLHSFPLSRCPINNKGYFCPVGFVCMLPCSEGGYCPSPATTETKGGSPFCHPYEYPVVEDLGCGGAASDSICPAGTYCPSNLSTLRPPFLPSFVYLLYLCYSIMDYLILTTDISSLCSYLYLYVDPENSFECPAGSYCREGSVEPKSCPPLTVCKKGTKAPITNFVGLLGIIILLFVFVILWKVAGKQKYRMGGWFAIV